MSYDDPMGDEVERQADRYAAEDARADREADSYWERRCMWEAEPIDEEARHEQQSRLLIDGELDSP